MFEKDDMKLALGGSIVGTIVDDRGAAVSGTCVTEYYGGGYGPDGSRIAVKSTRTDDKGSFKLSGVGITGIQDPWYPHLLFGYCKGSSDNPFVWTWYEDLEVRPSQIDCSQ